MHVLKIVALVALVAGCEPPPYRCESHVMCRHNGIDGTCEPTGFCSFPDDVCGAAGRYGAGATSGLANECVNPRLDLSHKTCGDRLGGALVPSGTTLFSIGGKKSGSEDRCDLRTATVEGTTIGPWSDPMPLPLNLKLHEAVIHAGWLYGFPNNAGVCQGIQGTWTDSSWALLLDAEGTPSSTRTSRLSSGFELRQGAAVIQHGEYVYRVGGKRSGIPLADVSRGTLLDGGVVWSPMQPLKRPLFNAGLAVVHADATGTDWLYVLGGCTKHDGTKCPELTREIEVAPIKTNGELGEFVVLDSLLLTDVRSHHRVVVHRHWLYLIGGLRNVQEDWKQGAQTGQPASPIQRIQISSTGTLGSTWIDVDPEPLIKSRKPGVALRGDFLYILGDDGASAEGCTEDTPRVQWAVDLGGGPP